MLQPVLLLNFARMLSVLQQKPVKLLLLAEGSSLLVSALSPLVVVS